MITKSELDRIHRAVPSDYYQRGIKKNVLQRIWHHGRFKLITHELIRLGITDPVLDLGCHSGDLTSIVAAATGTPTSGVDLSSQAIAYARSRFPAIDFRCVDFSRGLPFGDGSFQVATAFDVLEHVPNLPATLAEIRRVLEPGGYLIIGVPNETWLFKIIWFFWTKLRGHVWDGAHVQDFQQPGSYNLLLQAGFQNGVDIAGETLALFALHPEIAL